MAQYTVKSSVHSGWIIYIYDEGIKIIGHNGLFTSTHSVLSILFLLLLLLLFF